MKTDMKAQKIIQFSIIVPAYNLEKFLADCLNSIKNQSFKSFEVIVVNDGSKDKSSLIAKNISNSDKRFRVLNTKNEGVAAARNLGLENAEGEFVWFIDGDDYIHPESLSIIYSLFSKFPLADVVTFGYDITKRRYDSRFSSFTGSCSCQPIYFECTNRESFENALHFSPPAIWCVCYRRSVAKEVIFKKITCEDRFYILESYFYAQSVLHTRIKIYYYYQRDGSNMHNTTRGFMEGIFKYAHLLKVLRYKKNGWGIEQLYYIYCVEVFPKIMRHLLELKRKEDRKWAFKQLLDVMEEVQEVFPKNIKHSYIDRIVQKQNFLYAWYKLFLQYQPRWFLGRHPAFLRCYKSVAALIEK